MLGDAERSKAERVANDHQLAVGGDQDDVVGTVEALRNPSEDADPIGVLVLGLKLVGQRVHDDFGVGVSLQVVVALGQQLVLEGLVVGKLAVEREGKPLGLAAVVSLERLCIVSIVAAAGCVADVADRQRAVDPLHDRLEFLAMIEAKRLGDRAHFLVGLDQRTAVGPKTAHPRGELAAVLHVQQHPGHQSGHAVDVAGDRRQRRDRRARGMVNGGHAAFVVKLTHRLVPPRKRSGMPGSPTARASPQVHVA